jgi:hypothetical protein
VYNDVANIATINQKADNNGASIELVVDSSGVDKKIKSGSIMLAINEDQSDVKIKANKITFSADDYNVIADGINLSGYVTIENLKTDGRTEISGANITTGIIKSQNYKSSSGS